MDLSLEEETVSSLGELIKNGKLSQVVSLLNNEEKMGDSQVHLLSLILTFYRNFLSETSKILGILLPYAWIDRTVLYSKTRTEVLKIVRIFLQRGLNPNTVNDIETPLMTAVSTYDEDLLEILVKHGADPNLSAGQGKMNALALAIILNKVSIVKLFLTNRARVNAVCCQGMTPLQLAMNKSKCIFSLLRCHGANSQSKKPPLFHAVENDNVYLATVLLENGEDVNQSYLGDSPIHVAVNQGNEDMVMLLIQYGIYSLDKADGRGRTPLGLALNSRHGEKVAMILLTFGCSTRRESFINIRQNTYPPTHIAAFLGYDFHLNILKFLLERSHPNQICPKTTSSSSADCRTEDGRTLLPKNDVKHVKNGHVSTEESSDSKFSDGDDVSNDTNLQMSTQESRTGCSKRNIIHDDMRLLDGENLINYQASDRSTPLFMAVLGGSLEFARYLYSRGGDPYITSRYGNLIHAAVMSRGSQELLQFALNFDLNINMTNDFGNTPLTLTLSDKGTNHVRFGVTTLSQIFQSGCQNIADVRLSETVLSQNAYFDCEDIAEILICNGANPDIPKASDTTWTALNWAIINGTERTHTTCTALNWAIINGTERTLLLLLEAGVHLTKSDLAKYPRDSKVMRNPEFREMLDTYSSQPASLQMCCRWMLRRHLSQLVHGRSIVGRIKRLPVPQRLREFVAIKLLDS